MACPLNFFAKASALVKVRFDTNMVFTPFACKCVAVNSLMVPAPKMRTVASESGLSRLSSAKLTAV